MATRPLLPDPECLTLDCLTIRDGIIVFAVRTRRPTAGCPLCGCLCDRVHSHYQRKLLDLPWQGNAVRIERTARRFFCDNRACSRRVFTEPIPTIAARYARKTVRLAEALRELTLLVGGEAAARIAAAFGLAVSPDALLNALKQATLPCLSTPRVLGVDDFAFQRGRRYGTILVDLERRCPIDLLPDREPDTLTDWLQAHPGIEVISRDRGAAYREGATRGAPDAGYPLQVGEVADRWHLLKNLGDALERLLLRHHKALQTATMISPPPCLPLPDPLSPRPAPCQVQDKTRRRERRLSRFEEIKRLLAEGHSQREVSRPPMFTWVPGAQPQHDSETRLL